MNRPNPQSTSELNKSNSKNTSGYIATFTNTTNGAAANPIPTPQLARSSEAITRNGPSTITKLKKT